MSDVRHRDRSHRYPESHCWVYRDVIGGAPWLRCAPLVLVQVAVLTSGCGLPGAPQETQSAGSVDDAVSIVSSSSIGNTAAVGAETGNGVVAEAADSPSAASPPPALTVSPIDPVGTIAENATTPQAREVEPGITTSDDVEAQSPVEETSQAKARNAAEQEQQRAAEEQARREAEEAAQAAKAARGARERDIAYCREIITEVTRVIQNRRSVERFNIEDDMINAARQDYEAVAASYTRTILGLYDQVAAHDSVISSDACVREMDDETMQSWVSSRHETVAKLEDRKKGCRRYFLEPALLGSASVPAACD